MVKKSQKFSVLMSVYEKEKPEYFDAALKSVLEQTLMPNEVVICEDGKIPDSLKNVIKKYKNKYPKIVRSVSYPKNRGLGLTLRDGVLECKNEIIFRMDTDDVSINDRFEKQLKTFLKEDVDVLGSNICEYDDKMLVSTSIKSVPASHEEIVEYAKRRNPINHMSVCFKKSKVLKSGNYMDMPCFEDYYLWVRMLNDGCIFRNIQENLVNVRGGESMIKRRGGKRYLRSIKRFEKTLIKMNFISRKEYFENMVIRSVSSMMPQAIRGLLYHNALRRTK